MKPSRQIFKDQTRRQQLICVGLLALLGATACMPTHFEAVPTNVGVAPLAPSFEAPPIADAPIVPPVVVPVPVPVVNKLTDSFVQDESGNQVDILIVNDNSLSMYEEQTKLAERFGSFIGNISDIDYHIGMTTTDLESPRFNQDGRLLTWAGTSTTVLTRAIAGGSSIFENTVKRKETLDCDGSIENCPASNERPLDAMIRAFEQQSSANVGFFRPKAPLVLVILSDEDEESNALPGSTQPLKVLTSFAANFGVDKRMMSFGIIIKPGDVTCQKEQQAQAGGDGMGYFGTAATALALLTGGDTMSICEKDYAKPLADLSRKMRTLVTSYELKKEPKDGHVTVTFTPAVNIAYKVKGKLITFDSPPPFGTRIDVSYNE